MTELFIARRLRLGGEEGGKQSPSLSIAMAAVTLSIVIMWLSIAIVCGFKNEITRKVLSLDAHVRVVNAAVGVDDNIAAVDARVIMPVLRSDSAIMDNVAYVSLIAEKPAILKTADDFKAVMFRGVDSGYNWSTIGDALVAGRVPRAGCGTEVALSQKIARLLRLSVGDDLYTYFIDHSVRTRKCVVVGVYNSNFDEFDSNYILGDISVIQGVNKWNDGTGNYVGIEVRHPERVGAIGSVARDVYRALARHSCTAVDESTVYTVTSTLRNNISFFSWLGLLDMNVVIILVLMAIVSAFTLVSALLMIVLGRIRMIGLLKAFGATNGSVRNIFIVLTQKIIIKAMVIGNVTGFALASAQRWLHVVRLDPESYYMCYVPVDFNWLAIVALNVGILVVSYLTLLGPSYIVARINATTTLRYE